MQSTDWVVLLMTFVTGAAAGVFIYMTGFRDIDIHPEAPTPAGAFEVAVDVYGGCARGGGVCPSYRLNHEGEYTFLPYARGEAPDPVRGKVDTDLIDAIGGALVEADLVGMSQPKKWDSCDSWIDGTDQTYRIEYEEAVYVLDTCNTAIDVDDELVELLDELFEVLQESSLK